MTSQRQRHKPGRRKRRDSNSRITQSNSATGDFHSVVHCILSTSMSDISDIQRRKSHSQKTPFIYVGQNQIFCKEKVKQTQTYRNTHTVMNLVPAVRMINASPTIRIMELTLSGHLFFQGFRS